MTKRMMHTFPFLNIEKAMSSFPYFVANRLTTAVMDIAASTAMVFGVAFLAYFLKMLLFV